MPRIFTSSVGGSGEGSPGPQGPAGDSAYDIAVKNGFTGTEQEWLDSIGGGELPQNLSTNASPTFDKIYTMHNSDGTNVKIGDDAWIGDIDIANHISIQGVGDDTKGGVVFGSNETELISSDGINLTLEADNDIILLPGSSYAYIGTPLEDGSNRIAKMSDITGGSGTDNHGDFSFAESTMTAQQNEEIYIQAKDENDIITSDLRLGVGDTRMALTAYENNNSYYSLSNGSWTTGLWTGTQIVFNGATDIVWFHENIYNSALNKKISLNNGPQIEFDYAEWDGSGNITFYVMTAANPEPTEVTEINFLYSLPSYINVDYDNNQMNMVSNNRINIQTKNGRDIRIKASDDIDIEAGDVIRFYTNTNDNSYNWRMDSTNGEFQFPGSGYISNPVGASGDDNGFDTLKIAPDVSRADYDQYLIIDPTAPNHIHIRPGGMQDYSQAELILGGERTHVKTNDSTGSVTIKSKKQNWSWTYQNINEAGDSTYIVNTAAAEPNLNDYTIYNGVKYFINSVNVLETTKQYTAISSAGSYLTFIYGDNYTFIRENGEYDWTFDSNGYISGPSDGSIKVYGIYNDSDYDLPIIADRDIVISAGFEHGEFLNSTDDPNNQIATIGDINAISPVKVRFSPVFQATNLTFTGSGATYPTYNSWYVKYGDMVTFSIKCDMSTVTNFGTGQLKLELPFAPLSTAANHFSAWCWVDPSQPADELNGHVQLVADHLPGSQILDLHWLKETTATPKPLIESLLVQGTPITFTTSSILYVNGTYIAN